MNLYAYCLSDQVTAESIEHTEGVAASRPWLVCVEGVSAVVSNVSGEDLRLTRENVFAHERVIKTVLSQVTPLPFRFGMITSHDRLERYIKENRRAILANLERVRGAFEMSVKVIWDLEAASRAATGGGVAAREGEESADSPGPGTAFLLAKKRQMSGDSSLKSEADRIATWLSGLVRGAVRDSLVEVTPGESMVIKAAYLVERSKLQEYQERIKLMRDQQRALRFLSSGPWAPYSFSKNSP